MSTPRERPKTPLSTEFVCDGEDSRDRKRSGVLAVQLFALPGVVGMVLSRWATPEVALAGMVLAAGTLIWWWRRPADRLVVRVEAGEVIVTSSPTAAPVARLSLTDLDEVSLDTKEVDRVVDGGSAIPALRVLDNRVAPTVDTSRILFIDGRNGSSTPLTRDRLPHMTAVETFAKLRVFLRGHGWLPKDERERA